MPHLRLLACTAIAVFAASWVRAELVEMTCDGTTVFTGGDASANIPEAFAIGSEPNNLQLTAVFDPDREPIAVTATSATYEALYGYGMVNDLMVPLHGITLELQLADDGEGTYASFVLSGTTADGWQLWVDGFSEDPQFVPSLDFPVDGFSEPADEFYRRCDIGASGAGWHAFSDQTFLPVCTRIPDPSGDAGWQAVDIEPQFGRFTLTYDATPSAAKIDAVTGLSRLPADFYTDLVPIVRFAPSGRIDARNGDRYQAVKRLTYKAGVRYRVKLTVDLWSKRYSAIVTPKGGKAVTIAKNFAFRSEHRNANELRVFNSFSATGSLDVRNVRLRETDTAGILSSGTWENALLPAHRTAFTVQYRVTPSRSGIDVATGLSGGPADWFDDLAVIVRFAPDGTIDARNGNRYRAETRVRYEADMAYDVRLDVNLATRRYSATVQPEGGRLKRIANNYVFRTEQADVVALDTFTLFSTGGGAAEVTQLAVQ